MVRDKRASKEMIKQVSSTLRNYAPENTEVQSLLSEELDEMDSLIQEEEEGKAYSSDKTQASSFRMSKLRKK